MPLDEQGYDKLDRPFYRQGKQRFIVTLPINGQPATAANGGTIGFELSSCDAVYAWHQAGVDHCGRSAESAPHIRADGNVSLTCVILLETSFTHFIKQRGSVLARPLGDEGACRVYYRLSSE
ncbi:hypothetical protein [Rosenbergiella gaditana]|uniref:hypothetical protein n=1 Tax=Rosenbergiella gaditana TaxID=2726987 RepID=UPI002023F3C0|nr:hypothetical protein [Rosenbergiella gaditana]